MRGAPCVTLHRRNIGAIGVPVRLGFVLGRQASGWRRRKFPLGMQLEQQSSHRMCIEAGSVSTNLISQGCNASISKLSISKLHVIRYCIPECIYRRPPCACMHEWHSSVQPCRAGDIMSPTCKIAWVASWHGSVRLYCLSDYQGPQHLSLSGPCPGSGKCGPGRGRGTGLHIIGW